MKDSLIFYISQYDAVKELNDEQLGRLFRALFETQIQNNQKQPENNSKKVVLGDDIKIAFNFINNQLVVDAKKYQEKVEKLTANAKKGGAKKGNQNARKQQNNQNNQIESDNVNVNVNDNANVNVNVNADDECKCAGTTDGCFPSSASQPKDEIVEFYLNNINPMPTAHELELLESYEQDTSHELIIYAMEKAVENKARSIAYVKGILNSWASKGITTLAEAKEEGNKKQADTGQEMKNVWDVFVKNHEKDGENTT